MVERGGEDFQGRVARELGIPAIQNLTDAACANGREDLVWERITGNPSPV